MAGWLVFEKTRFLGETGVIVRGKGGFDRVLPGGDYIGFRR
jgi:hypothetical protein